MPRQDWARARAFGYMTALLHFDKLAQIPNVVLNQMYGVPYKDIIDAFIRTNSSDKPIISEISSFFIDKARDIQSGGAEYCESKKWLNIWWPADELAYINLAAEGKLQQFYAEAGKIFSEILERRGETDQGLIQEAIAFNSALLKLPFQSKEKQVSCNYNVQQIYQSGLIGVRKDAVKEKSTYIIHSDRESWKSWDEWCEKVVWWGNKKGDYLYKHSPVSEKEKAHIVI